MRNTSTRILIRSDETQHRLRTAPAFLDSSPIKMPRVVAIHHQAFINHRHGAVRCCHSSSNQPHIATRFHCPRLFFPLRIISLAQSRGITTLPREKVPSSTVSQARPPFASFFLQLGLSTTTRKPTNLHWNCRRAALREFTYN